MKLHLATPRNRAAFTGYGPGYIAVNGNVHRSPLLLTPDGTVVDWTVDSLAILTAEAIRQLLEYAPEIIILGTGTTQLFPDASTLRQAYEAGVGLEIMGTAAACRTYNILNAEERRVLAAMWPP